MLTHLSWCLLVLAHGISATPRSHNTCHDAPDITFNVTNQVTEEAGLNACARISAIYTKTKASRPKFEVTVPASLAHECLQSVPNKPQPAQRLIKSLQAFVQWQSTLAWLKDPPKSYHLPATDVVRRLDQILTKSIARGFKSEYDFQVAIHEAFVSAHDGHFVYAGDILRPFHFENAGARDIVSVSNDGLTVPELYLRRQLKRHRKPSPIVKINGQNATAFIEGLGAKFSSYQDVNSQWNSMFPIYAEPDARLPIAASSIFQGPDVTLSHADGFQTKENSIARLARRLNFSGINSGEDFYKRFCDPESATAPNKSDAFATAPITRTRQYQIPQSATLKGYPKPLVADKKFNTTSGYYLKGSGYNNVAVLALSAFGAPDARGNYFSYLTNFQQTVEAFLKSSKTAGKKRLVIDLTANSGGLVVAAYELFAQLFPEAERFQANNLRLSNSLLRIAEILNSIPEEQLRRYHINSSITTSLVHDYRGLQSHDGTRFKTVRDLLGPVNLRGDHFTAYQSIHFKEPSPFFNMTGVGSRAKPMRAVFAPKDIVLLTDGTCGSACTLFSYLMILGQKVKTTVVGGRPIAGPMQSIAGVEGAQVCAFREIRNTARAAIEIAPKAQRHGLRGGEVGILAEGYAAKRGLGAINVKNQFSKGHLETPMQFLEQNANCRFFYTAKMLGSPELVWKRAIDATWTDPKKNCVQGSRQNDPETPLKKDPKIPLKNGSARVSLRSSSHFIITITTVVLLSTGLFLW